MKKIIALLLAALLTVSSGVCVRWQTPSPWPTRWGGK